MCAWKCPWPDQVRFLFSGYCEDEEVTAATHFNCSDLYYDGGDCLVDSVTGWVVREVERPPQPLRFDVETCRGYVRGIKQPEVGHLVKRRATKNS